MKDKLWTFHLAAGYAVGYDVVDDFFEVTRAIGAP